MLKNNNNNKYVIAWKKTEGERENFDLKITLLTLIPKSYFEPYTDTNLGHVCHLHTLTHKPNL